MEITDDYLKKEGWNVNEGTSCNAFNDTLIDLINSHEGYYYPVLTQYDGQTYNKITLKRIQTIEELNKIIEII